MNSDKNQQEETQKMIAQQLMGQQLQQIEQQVEVIGSQIQELKNLKENLAELKNYDKRSIHTPMGAGVFLESELKKPETVLLNVGAGVIVKKDTDSAIKIIGNQVEELKKIQEQMQNELKNLVGNLQGLH
jgi:prefoldin alpha subunit